MLFWQFFMRFFGGGDGKLAYCWNRPKNWVLSRKDCVRRSTLYCICVYVTRTHGVSDPSFVGVFRTILKKSAAAFYSRIAHTNNTVTRSRFVSFFTHTVAMRVVKYTIIITTQNRLIAKNLKKTAGEKSGRTSCCSEKRNAVHTARRRTIRGISN